MKIERQFTNDPRTDLKLAVRVRAVNIDFENEAVEICLNTVLLAPNGEVANVIKYITYWRRNGRGWITDEAGEQLEADVTQFDDLAASQVGQAIIGMLYADLAKIIDVDSAYETLK